MIAARPLIELAYHLTLRAGRTEQPIAPVVLFVLDQGIPPRGQLAASKCPPAEPIRWTFPSATSSRCARAGRVFIFVWYSLNRWNELNRGAILIERIECACFSPAR